jgi:hypothetical protein
MVNVAVPGRGLMLCEINELVGFFDVFSWETKRALVCVAKAVIIGEEKGSKIKRTMPPQFGIGRVPRDKAIL